MPEPERIDRLTLWRAYVPHWAHDPLSGAGAAQFGGRWNAVGQPCLYAALELSTAWAEYNQGFVQHPATIAQLTLAGVRLADLTKPSLPNWMSRTPSIRQSGATTSTPAGSPRPIAWPTGSGATASTA